MTISRRSFARSVIAALAGATAVRQVAAAAVEAPVPVAATSRSAFTVEEVCKVYDVPVGLVTECVTLSDEARARLKKEFADLNDGPRPIIALPEGWGVVRWFPHHCEQVLPPPFPADWLAIARPLS